MIREFDLNCIQGVRDGMFLYEDNGKIEKIDIKISALTLRNHILECMQARMKSSLRRNFLTNWIQAMHVNLECGGLKLTWT